MILDLDYSTMEVPGFDGVTADVKPLKVSAYQEILRIMGKIYGADGATDAENLMKLSNEELSSVAQKVLPEHAKNLKGLQVKEGGSVRDATIDDVVEYGAMLPVAVSMLTTLFSRAMLTEEEGKNSTGQPANS